MRRTAWLSGARRAGKAAVAAVLIEERSAKKAERNDSKKAYG
jgi:hypothetical protein